MNKTILQIAEKTKLRQQDRMQLDATCSVPALRFSPTAWAKLQYLRDRGPTEIGGFGVCASSDLLHVDEVFLIDQVCTPVGVKFDDNSVADFFDSQIDRGLKPEQFGRIWVHTHPGHSAMPTGTDEETFRRAFGRTDWAVMFILARGGQTYARLGFNVGPKGSLEIPVEIDFGCEFPGTDWAAWDREYEEHVTDWEPLNGRTDRSRFERYGLVEPAPSVFGPTNDRKEEWREAWEDYVAAAHGVVWPE